MADIKITGKKAGGTAIASFTAVGIAQFIVAQAAPILASHGITLDPVVQAGIVSTVAGALSGIYAGLINLKKHWIGKK